MEIKLSLDDFKSFRRFGCLIAIFLAIQLIVLSTIAMIFYPGGYKFFGYYFSHLGAETAPNGQPNIISFRLFVIMLFIGAILGPIIYINLLMVSIKSENKREKRLSIVATIFAFIISPAIIGVALNPMDTQPIPHFLFARLLFTCQGTSILCYSIAFLSNKQYHKAYGLYGIYAFGIAMVYTTLSFANVLVFSGSLSVILPVIQKITVYSNMLWSLSQVKRLWPLVEQKS